jgi:hypothetical protein
MKPSVYIELWRFTSTARGQTYLLGYVGDRHPVVGKRNGWIISSEVIHADFDTLSVETHNTVYYLSEPGWCGLEPYIEGH